MRKSGLLNLGQPHTRGKLKRPIPFQVETLGWNTLVTGHLARALFTSIMVLKPTQAIRSSTSGDSPKDEIHTWDSSRLSTQREI